MTAPLASSVAVEVDVGSGLAGGAGVATGDCHCGIDAKGKPRMAAAQDTNRAKRTNRLTAWIIVNLVGFDNRREVCYKHIIPTLHHGMEAKCAYFAQSLCLS